MNLSHLSDGVLLHNLALLVRRDRNTTAELLGAIAEVDARKLYAHAGYSSMYLYCVDHFHMEEGAAFRRITAARVARRHPALLDAVADGRLHLTSVSVLAPYLTEGNVQDLVAAAAHKTKAEVEQLIATRYPKTDVLSLETPVAMAGGPGGFPPREAERGEAALGRLISTPRVDQRPMGTAPSNEQAWVQAPVGEPAPAELQDVMKPSCQLIPGRVGVTCRPHVAPLSAQSVVVQVTLEKGTYELLGYARQLLSHQIPSGDLSQVIDRAFRALVRELEKVRFAATENPRETQAKPIPGSRHIPDAVRRAVWERDHGQCTYVSDAGHQCQAREFIEFDHVQPFAHGGDSSVENLRLRCRAHNQLGAEVTYGTEFMKAQRRKTMCDGSRGNAA